MCNNIHKIYQPYIGRTMYVKCGHCEGCLQEKADKRANRIRNHIDEDYIMLFFTLTYADAYVPYFYIKDLEVNKENYINIYRDHDVRFYYHTGAKESVPMSNLKGKLIDTYYNRWCTQGEIDTLHDIGFGRCAVLHYPDIQNFFKKLRSNLERHDKYRRLTSSDKPITYFVTGEYGEGKEDPRFGVERAHWHVLLRVPKFNVAKSECLELWKEVVCKSWLYAFPFVTKRRFEIARNAASYVSQYVNCSADISKFLRRDDFRPCWHYSQGLGTANKIFSLSEILKALDRGNLQYNVQYTTKDGLCKFKPVPFPEYVLSRYFPRFKGRFKLSDTELSRLLGNGINQPVAAKTECSSSDHLNIWYLFNSSSFEFCNKLNWTEEDKRSICIRLENCFKRFHKDSGLNRSDYIFYFIRYLHCKNRNLNLMMYTDFKDDSDYFQRYDNIKEVFDLKPSLLDTFGNYIALHDDDYICEPNNFIRNVQNDLRYRDRYFSYVKTKKQNVLIYE